MVDGRARQLVDFGRDKRVAQVKYRETLEAPFTSGQEAHLRLCVLMCFVGLRGASLPCRFLGFSMQEMKRRD